MVKDRMKNFPAEENKPKTQSVNKNHTSQRYWPLEVLTLSVEESPKVLEKRWFPLGPDRWSSVELASQKRSLEAAVNNRGARVKCFQVTAAVDWVGGLLVGSRSRSRRRWMYMQGEGREPPQWEMTLGSEVGLIRSQQLHNGLFSRDEKTFWGEKKYSMLTSSMNRCLFSALLLSGAKFG